MSIRTAKMGPLSRNSATLQHFIPARQAFPLPERVCNATAPTDSRYSAKPDLSYRGQDKRLPSRGVGC